MANPVTRFFASRGFARAIGSVGRLLVTSGTVMLLLVAYQLWGTNLQTAQSQSKLADDFAETLDSQESKAPTGSPTTGPGPETTGTTAPTTPDDTTNGDNPVLSGDDPVIDGGGGAGDDGGGGNPEVAPSVGAVPVGQALGTVSIPSIGLSDFYFVEGTGVDQLKRGAAHYPGTPLPGQAGNAAIAGHRTTYGAPFHNIEKVEPGDMVQVQTLQGTFTYETRESLIVEPDETWVLDQGDENLLTLTACHPKFSAAQRIILFAELVENPVDPLPDQATASEAPAEPQQRGAIDEYGDEPVLTFPGAWWGLATVGLWLVVRLAAWQGHRSRRFPRWIPYVAGTPVCLVMLYFFFESFSYEAFALSLNLSV